MMTGRQTLNSSCSAMLPHPRGVVSNSATARTFLLHPCSDLVQPSRGSPRAFVASLGASSILLAPALTTIFVYPMVVTKSMPPTMGVVVPPRTMTRTTGRFSRLRTRIGRFYICADGHFACLGGLVVFGWRCITFLCSRACSESSVLAHAYLTLAHTRQGDGTCHSVFDYFLCRLANHTILPHPHTFEFKHYPATRTWVLSRVGRLFHLWPFRFLQVNVARSHSFSYHTDNARSFPASRPSREYASRVSSLTPTSQSALLLAINTYPIITPRQPHQSLTPSHPPLRPTSAAKAHSSIAFVVSMGTLPGPSLFPDPLPPDTTSLCL